MATRDLIDWDSNPEVPNNAIDDSFYDIGSNSDYGVCPMCSKLFPMKELEVFHHEFFILKIGTRR